jgi:hypothetical protein
MPISRLWLVLLVVAAALAPTLVSTSASARCMSHLVESWPAPGARDVPVDAALFVVIHDASGVAGALGNVALAGGGQRVPLRVAFDSIASNGSLETRTIALVPASPLRANASYRLTGTLLQGQATPMHFTTGRASVGAAPVLASARAGAFAVQEYGCGPSHTIPIALGFTPSSAGPSYARVRLARTAEDLAAGRLVGETLVPIENGTAEFGHGMCYGNWALEPGDRFFASVSIVNAAFAESAAQAPVVLAAR